VRILLTADPEVPVPPALYGGIERIVDMLVRQLVGRGHDVGLVAHRGSTAPAKLFPWPGTRSQCRWDSARNTVALWRAVQQFQPDVLHSFSRLLYMSPQLLTSLPKVMSYQRKPGRRQVASAVKLGGRTLMFTGCSEHICSEGRVGGGVWTAIYNGVPLEKYTFQPAVASDAPLVFLSRVERLKGAHAAIDIARRTGKRLLIAGNHGTNGEDGIYWRDCILPHIGKDRIEYVGEVDDAQKNELLGSAAALVVPVEWNEPFGIVFAEALACGTPVVSRPLGALPEIVRHGIEGYLVDNVDQACAAVDRLAGIDRRGCRARAESMFSASVIGGRYEMLYDCMVTRPGELTA
jgi:glycosyltransferase involved in cell wall biosynthesis